MNTVVPSKTLFQDGIKALLNELLAVVSWNYDRYGDVGDADTGVGASLLTIEKAWVTNLSWRTRSSDSGTHGDSDTALNDHCSDWSLLTSCRDNGSGSIVRSSTELSDDPPSPESNPMNYTTRHDRARQLFCVVVFLALL